MNLVLLGPPGTGKGTIAQFLEEKLGIVHVSTGDALREEVKKHTELGAKIEPLINRGVYVDDATVAKIVEKRIDYAKGKSLVFDGYPRTLKQAEKLNHLLSSKNMELTAAIYISTTAEEVIRRLSARRQCAVCNMVYGPETPPKAPDICDSCGNKLYMRPDDMPEVVRERLKVYKEQTAPIIKFYKDAGVLVEVDGNHPPKEVIMGIEKAIKELEEKTRKGAKA